jgi:uncharacterized protein
VVARQRDAARVALAHRVVLGWAMYSRPVSAWLSLIASVVLACGTAAAQDFRSGLSAYNGGDYARAFQEWLGLAEQGDAAAEAGLGFLFHKGLGVTQDDAEAATWFVKAAEQGQAEAQLLLGTLFFFGQGVPQNYVTAFAWCDIAETNGQSDASECRDAALEHLTPAEMAQSYKIVSDWLGRHLHASP